MVKEKTAALERAKKATAQEKAKKSGWGGSSSRSALLRGRIQGDRMPSVIRQEDLDQLAEGDSFLTNLRASRGTRSSCSLSR